MPEKRVGIRELKAQLSAYLQEVRKGHTLIITDRGMVIGRITPAEESLGERMEAMIKAGVISWNGKKLTRSQPVARLRPGSKTLAEIVSENRD